MTVPSPHTPVMVGEVVAALAPRDGGIYVDATFGAGGYTRALLEAARCTVFAIDRDSDALQLAEALADHFPGRFTFLLGRFGEIAELLAGAGVGGVDGVAFDLGVSSMQLDDPDRGFSFRADGPLDMRMDSVGDGPTAADVVNRLPEGELAELIWRLGEERAARRVARAIVAARARGPIARTLELAEIVRRSVPRSKDGIDPATRTFQALRIHVNDELGELDRALSGAEIVLSAGGRLAVVAFHSLEDRAVKTFFAERAGAGPRPSRHVPVENLGRKMPTFRLIARGTARPSATEIAANPRARSARLRWAERTDAPAWPSGARRAA